MVAFEVLILHDSGGGVTYGSWDVTKTRSDGEVKSERGAAAPAWQIDVRRAAGVRRGWSDPVFWKRTLERAWLEEPWLLEFRIKTRGGGEVENEVAEEVVPLGTITAARTYKAMVAELVQNSIAQSAYPIRFEKRNPEPPKNTRPKQERIDIVLMAGRRTGMKPNTRAGNSS